VFTTANPLARRLRVGLVGCGNVALSDHLPAYLAMPESFDLVAVADPTPARVELARAAAGLDGADAHSDPLDLIARDDLDMVDLCTPQHVRRDLALAAVKGGRHVLSEKPITTIPADARQIVDAARAADVRYGVVHNYLLFPEVLRVLELVAAGEIGPVEVALLDWLGCADHPGNPAYRPRWRHDAAQAGGGVLMDMLHIVYLAEALLGARVERVSGWVHGRDLDAPVEDIALARLESEEGAALVNVGWGQGPGGFAVSGPEGRVEVTYRDGGSGAFAPFEQLEVHGRGGHRIERDLAGDDPMRGIVRDFGEAVTAGRDPIASAEQGLHILEATLAVYLSAAMGTVVTLPLPQDHPIHLRGIAGLAELDLPAWSPVRRRGMFGLARAEG
jgi:predicted dehydrogenase